MTTDLDGVLSEALELPLNGPARFWLGFVLTDDPRLGESACRMTAKLVQSRGRVLEAHAAAVYSAAAQTAKTVLGHADTTSLVWLDWSGLGTETDDRAAVERSLAMLNVGRARLSKALRGGLVIVAANWVEECCACGAVDLWSGREFVLRLRSTSQPQPKISPDPRPLPERSQGWRRQAPMTVMRMLRENGPTAALRHADELVGSATDDDVARLEVVAAGLALAAGDQRAARERALAVLDMDTTTHEVLTAAAEIVAATAHGRDASTIAAPEAVTEARPARDG